MHTLEPKNIVGKMTTKDSTTNYVVYADNVNVNVKSQFILHIFVKYLSRARHTDTGRRNI